MQPLLFEYVLCFKEKKYDCLQIKEMQKSYRSSEIKEYLYEYL